MNSDGRKVSDLRKSEYDTHQICPRRIKGKTPYPVSFFGGTLIY